MPTLGHVVRALEERLFSGRQQELAAFQQWLTDAPTSPEILNVCGPGGVGKTALLAAFQRHAEGIGWSVIVVDGRNVVATPDGLAQALGAADINAAIERISRLRPLLLLDSFEHMAGLSRYLLDTFLPRLDEAVRLVIAGRNSLIHEWERADAWRSLVRVLTLKGLAPEDARAYLIQRGLTDRPQLLEEILEATRGYPLGLSLAADLAERRHLETLEATPEWPLVLRTLVERLRESEDSRMQRSLESAALVRQFDEATLAAMSRDSPDPEAFARLCSLSIVRPVRHGLMLHDEVRRILASDLRWRDPERYSELRQRALAHYRDRALVASPAEQERLLAERLALWENAFVQALVYAADDSGAVWLESGGPADLAGIRRVFWYWVEHVLVNELTVHYDRDTVDALLAGIVRHPAAHIMIARSQGGEPVGVLITMPVYSGSVAILADHPDAGPVLKAYWSAAQLAALPEQMDLAPASYILFLAHTDVEPVATRAALLRAAFGSFARGVVHFVVTPIPAYKQMLDALGFDRIADARTWGWSDEHPTDGYVLDVGRIGLEAWIEAIMAGRRPSKGLQPEELQRELKETLVHWHDDDWLIGCRLWEAAPLVMTASQDRRPRMIREAIEQRLDHAKAGSEVDKQLAFHALELAYLTRGVSHEAAAERLSVSRATLYRLLQRGIRHLARELETS